MQREIERLEEERIQLKTENRKLARQLGGKVCFIVVCTLIVTYIQIEQSGIKKYARQILRLYFYNCYIGSKPWFGC